ncbi:MAG: hypothetical protein P0116_02900 [Candidatus Nitrosocosmicus sp.]|nr:hypothetical protein [Candidatus Nitrosocosmicus sp.]
MKIGDGKEFNKIMHDCAGDCVSKQHEPSKLIVTLSNGWVIRDAICIFDLTTL